MLNSLQLLSLFSLTQHCCYVRRSLLQEIDCYINFLKSYKHEIAKNFLLGTREAVSTLIDKGQDTRIETKASYGSSDKPSELFYFFEATKCFWLGYKERFKRFASKCLDMFGHLPQFNMYQIKFYHGKSRKPSHHVPLHHKVLMFKLHCIVKVSIS